MGGGAGKETLLRGGKGNCVKHIHVNFSKGKKARGRMLGERRGCHGDQDRKLEKYASAHERLSQIKKDI